MPRKKIVSGSAPKRLCQHLHHSPAFDPRYEFCSNPNCDDPNHDRRAVAPLNLAERARRRKAPAQYEQQRMFADD